VVNSTALLAQTSDSTRLKASRLRVRRNQRNSMHPVTQFSLTRQQMKRGVWIESTDSFISRICCVGIARFTSDAVSGIHLTRNHAHIRFIEDDASRLNTG
jgi:hypothetical protein